MKSEMDPPLVSVCCTTYQHGPFIRHAIEGFLMQRTSFPIEIIIRDDASTDGTAAIVKEYADQHPRLIRAILNTENQFSKGVRALPDAMRYARGKYIAICEGDDYWTDPLKLQKQVDFMEANPGHSGCFHRAHKLKDGVTELFPIPDDVDPSDIRFDDLLRTYNFVTTASVMFRSSVLPLPAWYVRVPFGDMAIYAVVGSKGHMAMLPESMAVWRVTGSGAWTSLNKAQQDRNFLRFYRGARPHLPPAQQDLVDRKRRMILDREATTRFPTADLLNRVYFYGLLLREWWKDSIDRLH
ncbi:MAG: glycosyltransferase [Flavobacteriales bacterium]